MVAMRRGLCDCKDRKRSQTILPKRRQDAPGGNAGASNFGTAASTPTASFPERNPHSLEAGSASQLEPSHAISDAQVTGPCGCSAASDRQNCTGRAMTINPPHARSRMLLPLVLILLFFGWRIGTVRDIQDTEKVRKMTETMKTVCVGRFLVDVPAEAEVSFRGAFLSGWNIDTDPDETDDQFTTRLATKEVELKAKKNDRGGNSLESTASVDRNGIKGTVFVFDRIWTYGIEYGKRIETTAAAAHAYVRAQETSVNFTAEFGASRVKELARIVTQIKPLKEGEIPTEPGFCFGRAMLLDPLTASQNERVTMFLSLKDHPDFLIALDTEAGLKPNDPLLARDDRIKDEFASVAHALRRAERTISDIPGEELLERFRERDGIVSYSFTWESYSKQNDVFRPMLALEFSTDHSSRPGGKTIESGLTDGAALALWNKISSTIRLRPTQVVQVPVAEVIPPSLGAIVHANEACPATGWWQCDVDYVTAKIESGARQYFRKGDRMPQAVMLVPPTLGQRLQRQQPRFQSEIPTRWKLVQLVS